MQNSVVMVAVLIGAGFAAALGACASSSSSGGGGTGGGYGVGGASAGGSSAGGASAGGSSAGGSSAGGSSAGGSSAGGSSAGGSSAGGSSAGGSGGGGNVTLPAGCVTGGVTVQCNPITNAGCNTAGGQACDLGQDNTGKPGIGCFDPPNTQDLNQTCSNGSSGPFCKGTMHCSGETDAGGGTCKKFCCSKADCGSGTCNAIDSQLGTLGTCS